MAAIIGIALTVLLGIVSLRLAAAAKSKEGIPWTSSKRITGDAATAVSGVLSVFALLTFSVAGLQSLAAVASHQKAVRAEQTKRTNQSRLNAAIRAGEARRQKLDNPSRTGQSSPSWTRWQNENLRVENNRRAHLPIRVNHDEK